MPLICRDSHGTDTHSLGILPRGAQVGGSAPFSLWRLLSGVPRNAFVARWLQEIRHSFGGCNHV